MAVRRFARGRPARRAELGCSSSAHDAAVGVQRRGRSASAAPRAYRRYGRVAALLDDVFHQREVALPTPAEMDQLHRLTVALMQRRSMPASHAAQLAMADWIASLYLAGSEDW
ncbi:MAG TPA: hypothetical protein VIS07_01530 [Candidatus Binatia bacterium]